MSLEETIAATVETTLARILGDFTTRLNAMQQPSNPQPLLYREATAAELLGLAPATLKKWRVTGKVKAHTPAGSRVPLYSAKNLETICQQLACGELC